MASLINTVRLAFLGLMLIAALGCKPTAPLRIDAIQLGRSLNPDNTVAVHSTLFKTTDTVYVSILTPEAGSGALGVRWIYEGRLVDQPTKPVSYRKAMATTFQLQNGNGFPPGDYSVEVLLDGQPVGTRTFHVN
jgi:hypothetical protein